MDLTSVLLRLLLTLAVGGVFGLIFAFLKIPNGLRIGALFGTALLSIFFGVVWMPPHTQFCVQIVAGAIVGCSMEKSDLKRLPKVLKPMAITIGAFLILNLCASTVICQVSSLDPVTAMMSVIPGGVTEIPIISADMGADTPKVALAQLARYVLGVAIFPPMILTWDSFRTKAEAKKAAPGNVKLSSSAEPVKREKSRVSSVRALICTLLVSFSGGLIGKLAGIPAGTFLFAVIFVLVLKLKFDFAFVSSGLKTVTRLVSGCYIGSLITRQDILGIGALILPFAIILGGYTVNCFITGRILTKTCGFNRVEGMLITTPAGASDIVLSTADMGLQNTDIIIIHVCRSIIAQAIFPQIINALHLILP